MTMVKKQNANEEMAKRRRRRMKWRRMEITSPAAPWMPATILFLLGIAVTYTGGQHHSRDADDIDEALPAPSIYMEIIAVGHDPKRKIYEKHTILYELSSFDPASGYLELMANGKTILRSMDPSYGIFDVHHSISWCTGRDLGQCISSGEYTARLYDFAKPDDPVAVATIAYEIEPPQGREDDQGEQEQEQEQERGGQGEQEDRDEDAMVEAEDDHAGERHDRPGDEQQQQQQQQQEREEEEEEEYDEELASGQGEGKDEIDPSQAQHMWPLPCERVMPFPGFPSPSAYLTRPRIVLAYPPHDLGWASYSAAQALWCDPPCLWLLEMSCPEAADVLVFSCGYSQRRHGNGAPAVPRLPHQRWLHMCMESTGGTRDDEFLSAMDAVATYELGSDVPLLYVPGALSLFDRSQRDIKRYKGLAMFAVSNCGMERDIYLRQLMLHMDIDSYGRCLNNANLPSASAPAGRGGNQAEGDEDRSVLMRVMNGYKFVFAFENSRQRDYVTEKFYVPLMAGAVPVYLGAPNIQEFAPEVGASEASYGSSYIDASKFESPVALASYLLYLHDNDTAYVQYHRWRSEPWTREFQNLASKGINQGTVYNEGAVHGRAQVIDPSRVSNHFEHTHVMGVEGRNVTKCTEWRVSIDGPAPWSKHAMSLGGGLAVAVRIEGGECGGEPVTVAVSVGGEVAGWAELGGGGNEWEWRGGERECVKQRKIQLEGVRRSSTTLQAAVWCRGSSEKTGGNLGEWGHMSQHVPLSVVGVGPRDLDAVLHSPGANSGALNASANSRKCDGGQCHADDESGACDEGCSRDRACYGVTFDHGLGAYVVVLNLDRRSDRWEYVRHAISRTGVHNFSRISALDGRQLKKLSSGSMRSVEWLFRRNHFKNDPRVIGCALSHVKAWLLAVSCLDDGQALLVMEDDVEFSNGFIHAWGTAKASLEALEGGWDYVCVGGDQHLRGEGSGADGAARNFGSDAGEGILKVDEYVNCHGHAYLLTKGAAQFLLDRAAEEGIHCGVDWFMALQHRMMRTYAMDPFLVGQHPGVARKSDVQGGNKKIRADWRR